MSLPQPPDILLAAQQAPGMREALGEAWRFLDEGGVFMVLLMITSLLAVAVIVYKFITLARGRIVPVPLERRLEQLGERGAGNDALAAISVAAREGRSTLARLCAVALGHRQDSPAALAEAVQTRAREEVLRMQVGIPMLEVVITAAPMLGLLGTVSGLVTIFGGLGETADHIVIARGIGRALNTTIVGLAISLPSVIAHSYFSRRIDRLAARMEVLLGRLVGAAPHN